MYTDDGRTMVVRHARHLRGHVGALVNPTRTVSCALCARTAPHTHDVRRDPIVQGWQRHGRVTALPPAHSPLFDAARELLREGGDRSAAVSQLRESFPGASPGELDRLLRVAAVEVLS